MIDSLTQAIVHAPWRKLEWLGASVAFLVLASPLFKYLEWRHYEWCLRRRLVIGHDTRYKELELLQAKPVAKPGPANWPRLIGLAVAWGVVMMSLGLMHQAVGQDVWFLLLGMFWLITAWLTWRNPRPNFTQGCWLFLGVGLMNLAFGISGLTNHI